MNDRKQHVMKVAHQIFMEKGFQATSIQDILDYSGISKGTFYNYFSSKNELLLAIFHSLHEKFEVERNKLLIGQDPSNIEIFIKQIELQMKMNKQNKLFALFEEVFVSKDKDFKDYLKQTQLNTLSWTFHRFVDIYGESKKPYLLDCTILFTGMLHHQFHFFFQQKETELTVHQVIRYCINRLSTIVEDVSCNHDQLYNPNLIKDWFPTYENEEQQLLKKRLVQSICFLKNMIRKEHQNEKHQLKWMELLDFLQDELLQSKQPRIYLVESALDSLAKNNNKQIQEELKALTELIHDWNENKVK
ncbi:hypothetical protein AN964_05640 [Heyndrickxia shackletonii]|uniref:HTH tetR-type domain-containing protein n=1 Tax=Heyndrickxia shackletonii TaxID=157838 RepID=A0A0Q3WWN2_9BACI|nr:TetR/AcrR family transcriptional regulator [Heyndrickxia shackletonii]KQL53044.1 hypothetical protein AN964_05640 [Heyndrickxia shackletonii]NEY98599.1 TetR/AcrR family transcriptional regulator [Heyndrickxia shackletonii]